MPDITLELVDGRPRAPDMSVGGAGAAPAGGVGQQRYTLASLLRQALVPANPAAIQQLFDDGQRACELWLAMPAGFEAATTNLEHLRDNT
jgi:hypothetical protein